MNGDEVIQEYRITLPMSVEDYRIGQLYSVAEASKKETGGGEGVEIIVNEPFEGAIPGERTGAVFKGQFTHKVIYLAGKVPAFVRMLSPQGSLEIHEKSWNAYPYCRTVYSSLYMKEMFYVIIETKHESGSGDIENIHSLSTDELQKRVVDVVDIVNDRCIQDDYSEDEDPTKFKSKKTEQGPLQEGDWKSAQDPVMTCYKLYRIKFKWFGLQERVQKMIVRAARRLLFNFHRQVVCWIDDWFGMSIDDIRKIEAETKEELENLRNSGEPRGMFER